MREICDRSEVELIYQPSCGPRRGITIDKRSAGGWTFTEWHERDSVWQPIGSDIISKLSIEADPEALADRVVGGQP